MAGPRVEVPGFVADLAPLNARARISVSPLRYGAGVKGKVVAALWSGLPVVSTQVGVDGLGLRDGVDCLIADTAEGLAAAIVALWRDPARCAALAQAGNGGDRPLLHRRRRGPQPGGRGGAGRRTPPGQQGQAGTAPPESEPPHERHRRSRTRPRSGTSRYEKGDHVGTQQVIEGDPIDYTQHKFLYQHSIAKPQTGSLDGWSIDFICPQMPAAPAGAGAGDRLRHGVHRGIPAGERPGRPHRRLRDVPHGGRAATARVADKPYASRLEMRSADVLHEDIPDAQLRHGVRAGRDPPFLRDRGDVSGSCTAC